MGKYERILVGTDFSEQSRKAMAEAARFAREHAAKLHVLHVQVVSQPAASFEFAPLEDSISRIDQAALDAVARELGAGGCEAEIQTRRATGAADGILAYADEQGIDLIVLGTHGRGAVPELLLGSVAQDVVRRAPVSVLVVGARPAEGASGVLAPLDFCVASPGVLSEAARLAVASRAPLIVVHAVDLARLSYGASTEPEHQQQVARERLEAYVHAYLSASKLPLEVETLVAVGHAEDVILEIAATYRAGLIVIAPSSHSAIDRFLLGSVSKRVVRSAPCPVLVYRERNLAAQIEAAQKAA